MHITYVVHMFATYFCYCVYSIQIQGMILTVCSKRVFLSRKKVSGSHYTKLPPSPPPYHDSKILLYNIYIVFIIVLIGINSLAETSSLHIISICVIAL